MTRDELIALIARALEPDAWFNRENAFADFPDVADEVVLPSRNMARATLTAIEAAGMRVVPEDYTPANIALRDAFIVREGLWQKFIDHLSSAAQEDGQ